MLELLPTVSGTTWCIEKGDVTYLIELVLASLGVVDCWFIAVVPEMSSCY